MTDVEKKYIENVLVIGGGYVGLPLALLASKNSFSTYIYDNNDEKCSLLKKGISHIDEIHDLALKGSLENGSLKIISKSQINDSKYKDVFDVIVICVPTPLSENREPDLSMITNACSQAIKLIKPSTLLILESSTYPGTTKKVVLPILKEKFAELSDQDLLLAHSPERIDPGNMKWTNDNTPRIFAGLNEKSAKRTRDFYSRLGIPLVEVSTLEIAEAAKLFENTFRLVNISLVNEFANTMRNIGIDPNEILNAAYTKPFGIMPFQISAGIGGHCIPVDPYYLTWWANREGEKLSIVESAQHVNENMYKVSMRRIKNILSEEISGKRVLLAGITYKPGVLDVRETPALDLWNALENAGCNVRWWDPLVQTWGNREKLSEENFPLDLIVIVTPVDLPRNLSEKVPVLDLSK